MSKMKCISNNFRFVFAFGKIRISDDLCDLSKTCHPINDPSSCHPMWHDHMMIYGMATFRISFEDSKISKNMKFFFILKTSVSPEDIFKFEVRSFRFLSFISFLFCSSIRDHSLLSLLHVMDNLFFSLLVFQTNSSSASSDFFWLLQFFFSEDLQNRTSTRSVGLL